MNEEQELVQRRGPADAFGELALMYNVPRQATVTCASDYANLWALQRSTYREVCQVRTRKGSNPSGLYSAALCALSL